jgi:hypothetical protein
MLSRRILPTIADLVARAIADTDYLGDLAGTRHPDVLDAAHAAATEAAERWEMEHAPERVGGIVPAPLILDAAHALAARGEAWLADRWADRIDALADAFRDGDVDRFGEPVGYDRYRSAVA